MSEQPAKPDDLAFEEALEKLESIVEEMESGEVPLSRLVEQFEEGNRYLKVCQKRLHDAELKIEKLKAENEQIAIEPFDNEEEA